MKLLYVRTNYMNNSSLGIFCFRSYFDRNKKKLKKKTGRSSFLLSLYLCHSFISARDFLSTAAAL